MARPAAEAAIALDQLVRIAGDRAELLVRADLRAEQGRLFAASFRLPDGYELLSVSGEQVGDHYEQAVADGRQLHVNLRAATATARMVLVLVRRDLELGRFEVPSVTAIDPAGRPVARQRGRLAVQLDASLDASTAAVEGLTGLPPRDTE